MVWFRFNFFGLVHKIRRLAGLDPKPGHDLPDQNGKGNAHQPGFAGLVNVTGR
jgi:hypothetical protein